MGFYLFSYHRFEVNLRKQCEVARSQRKSDLLEGEAKRRGGSDTRPAQRSSDKTEQTKKKKAKVVQKE